MQFQDGPVVSYELGSLQGQATDYLQLRQLRNLFLHSHHIRRCFFADFFLIWASRYAVAVLVKTSQGPCRYSVYIYRKGSSYVGTFGPQVIMPHIPTLESLGISRISAVCSALDRVLPSVSFPGSEAKGRKQEK